VVTIAVCGMGKEQIARAVRSAAGDRATVEVKSDFEAANSVSQGASDYYIGACQSGAGGALAIATAILGADRVTRLSGVGVPTATPETIANALDSGKVAFGVAHSHIDQAIPSLVEAILKRIDS
jgi:tetrahydromethanopterin S-methyltransferase subunit C